jgi:hypothetical protein
VKSLAVLVVTVLALLARAESGHEPSRLATVRGPKGFAREVACPTGSRRVATPVALQPYKCVFTTPEEALNADFAAYRVPGEFDFEYPRVFQLQDQWKEDVPTLFLQLDENRAGKPVTITVTRYDPAQAGFEPMNALIAHDVDWLDAQDGGVVELDGRQARVTFVAQDTRSVYLPIAKDSYYAFVYSAPAAAYDESLPAFKRMLKSLRLQKAAL